MIYDPKKSHFDLDMKRGAQGEIFTKDICEALAAGSGSIETKTDAWFVHTNRLYVETECKGRDGVWRSSGINTTRAKYWVFKWGQHPGAFVVETDWLKRAAVGAGQDKRNHTSCDYGENPTRGVYVYINHVVKYRDAAFDEHQTKGQAA